MSSRSRYAFLVFLVLVFSGGFYVSVGGWAQGYTYNFDEVLGPYDDFQLNFSLPVGGVCRINFRSQDLVPVEYYTLLYVTDPPIQSFIHFRSFDNWLVQNSDPNPVDMAVVFHNPWFGQSSHITGWVSNDFFTVNSEIILIVAVIAVVFVAVGIGVYVIYKKFPRPKEEVESIEEVKPGIDWVTCSYCGSKYEATRKKCPNCGAFNKHMRR